MKTHRVLFILGSVLLFTACSNTVKLTRAECEATHWNQLGLEDGTAGSEQTTLKKRVQDCVEYQTSPDLTAYQSGYEKGLSRYCVYSKGVALGQSGKDFNNVCAQFEYVLFGSGWMIGNSKYKLKQELEDLSKHLSTTEAKLRSIESQVTTANVSASAKSEQEHSKAELEIQKARLAKHYSQLREMYDTIQQKINANIKKLSEK